MTLTEFYIATETRIEKAFPSYKRVKEGNKEKLESITNEQQTTLWTTTYRDSTSLIALNLLVNSSFVKSEKNLLLKYSTDLFEISDSTIGNLKFCFLKVVIE